MRVSRTRVYWLYVLLTVLQPLLFVLTGVVQHVSTKGGLAFMLVLLVSLAYGSRIAWGLLVVLNAIPLLAIGGMFGTGGQILWVNIVVMVLTGIALEAVLLSRPMRRQFIGRTAAPMHHALT